MKHLRVQPRAGTPGQAAASGCRGAGRRLRTWLLLATLTASGALPAAPTVRSQLLWDDKGLPQLQVTVTLEPAPPADKLAALTLRLGVTPVNQRGDVPEGFVTSHAVKLTGARTVVTLPVLANPPAAANLKPEDWKALVDKRFWDTMYGAERISLDYLRVSLHDEGLALDAEELLYPSRAESPLQASVRVTGRFGAQQAWLVLHLKAQKLGLPQQLDLDYRLLDGEGGTLTSNNEFLTLPENAGLDFEKELTPAANSSGPYTASYTLTNEALKWDLRQDLRFAFATALVTVSSMESDRLADWHLPSRFCRRGTLEDKRMPGPLDPLRLPDTLFGCYQPLTRATFATDVQHSGQRSLRLDYLPNAPLVLGSNLVLPGNPTAARLWVKGNNTPDKLQLQWRDPCNLGAAPHLRYMNSLTVEVCQLNFSDWRCFTVPVLGQGLVGRDTSAYSVGQYSRHPIQTPIYLGALRVIPAPRPKDAPKDAPADDAVRTIWVDDLQVETQVPRNGRLTLELRGETPENPLAAGAHLFVTVANGTGADLRKGRVTVTFQGPNNEAIKELSADLEVAAGAVAVQALALDPVVAEKPRGPVTAAVTVSGAVITQRAQGRLVLSQPTAAAVVWDFERRERFNAFLPAWTGAQYAKDELVTYNGKIYRSKQPNRGKNPASQADTWEELAGQPGALEPVAGGADGTANALPLPVAAQLPTNVILHPALPGLPAAVEMQVFGDGVPVTLQALFTDADSVDFDILFNQFANPPVLVDWQGWRTCRFAAPALPVNYRTGRGNPLYSPNYPLNLVLIARPTDERPSTIRVDQIVVRTHLPPAEELNVELDYPDETLLYPPGAPLRLIVTNFAAAKQALELRFRLTTPQGILLANGTRSLTLEPGARTPVLLVDKLREGFHHLEVEGLPGDRRYSVDIQAPDRTRFFGDTPMAKLADLPGLSATLGLTEKRLILDYDSAEPVPNMPHYAWFRNYAARESENQTRTLVPIVGYAADWAGPEKQAAVADGSYVREVGNFMQVPVRLADWDVFTRTLARECARDFATWIFWQGPDVPESPVYITPDKYPLMFARLSHWLRLYNPKARLVAGGFNFDRVLPYLDRMKEPDRLPFDEFEVRVSPGNVSLEEQQFEGFLADLDAKLKLTETKRKTRVVELDWETGPHLSMFTQAAYHARTAVLLHALGALPHEFASVNKAQTPFGVGMFFRPLYGNSSFQQQRNFFVPKPAYFAIRETRRLLADLTFVQRTTIPDRDPQAGRAYLFRDAAGGLCAALWRVYGTVEYRLPADWQGVTAVDAYGVPVTLDKVLPLSLAPLFLRFPNQPAERLAQTVRNLQPVAKDEPYRLVLDFVTGEAVSQQAAAYQATGAPKAEPRSGRLALSGERPAAAFLPQVTQERFTFTLEQPGDVLLSRLWYLEEGSVATLSVQLNGGPAQRWDLAPLKAEQNKLELPYPPGPRRSAFVLRGCRAGANEVALTHDGPTTSGGYRVTRIADGRVDLTAGGPLAVLHEVGVPPVAFRNVSGDTLTLGKQTYATGIGGFGNTRLEYVLNGQFARFETTVGIDALTKGRGSVSFHVFVDGVEKAKSGPMSGMTPAKPLRVDNLEAAQRLVLVVEDGGDGPEDDVADWVDPVLYLKENTK